MITLTNDAIRLFSNDRELFIKVQQALKISERTMYNYINSNSEELTKVAALNTIVLHTNQPLSLIITGGRLSKLMAK